MDNLIPSGARFAPRDTTAVPFEPLLTPEKAAELLGVHPGTLLRWAREGKVTTHHLGRKVMFRASSLNAWLDQQVQSFSANRAA